MFDRFQVEKGWYRSKIAEKTKQKKEVEKAIPDRLLGVYYFPDRSGETISVIAWSILDRGYNTIELNIR